MAIVAVISCEYGQFLSGRRYSDLFRVTIADKSPEKAQDCAGGSEQIFLENANES